MYGDDIDNGWDEPEPVVDLPPTGIDFEVDMVSTIAGEVDSTTAVPAGIVSPNEVTFLADSAEVDDALIEFVELVNARDLDGLADLLAPEVAAGLLGATSRAAVLEGLDEFFAANPTSVVTRGDLGVDPIAVVWSYDPDQERYGMVGYFTVEVAESDETRIERLDFVDEIPDWPELVVETPETAERPEWQSWDTNT